MGAERAETADEVAGGAAGVAASKPVKKPSTRGPTSGSLGKDGSLGNFGKLKSSLTSWRANTRSRKLAKSFSYNEAEKEELTIGGCGARRDGRRGRCKDFRCSLLPGDRRKGVGADRRRAGQHIGDQRWHGGWYFDGRQLQGSIFDFLAGEH